MYICETSIPRQVGDLLAICKEFDDDGNGLITYDEFTDTYLYI